MVKIMGQVLTLEVLQRMLLLEEMFYYLCK